MDKQKILIQVDSDPLVSTFDSIVAIDAGVDRLLTQAGVSSMDVEGLVHGAMFTRGGDDLKCTALFFGGSNVSQTESLVRAAKKCFFGPVRVSLMSDPNGCNTTAAAAVLSAGRHVDWSGCAVTVLAGTGPVGQRIAHLAGAQGAEVQVCSRSLERAGDVCRAIREQWQTSGSTIEGNMIAREVVHSSAAVDVVSGANVVFAAGAAGVQLLAAEWQKLNSPPRVMVDVNAVPPAGIECIEVTDKAVDRGGVICYGAVGVGGLKMKIHRRCLQQLFESNDRVLEVDEIYETGKEIESLR